MGSHRPLTFVPVAPWWTKSISDAEDALPVTEGEIAEADVTPSLDTWTKITTTQDSQVQIRHECLLTVILDDVEVILYTRQLWQKDDGRNSKTRRKLLYDAQNAGFYTPNNKNNIIPKVIALLLEDWKFGASRIKLVVYWCVCSVANSQSWRNRTQWGVFRFRQHNNVINKVLVRKWQKN